MGLSEAFADPVTGIGADLMYIDPNDIDAVSFTHLDVYKRQALVATAKKRGTLDRIEAEDIREIFDEIESSPVMETLWKTYQKNYSGLLYTSRCV